MSKVAKEYLVTYQVKEEHKGNRGICQGNTTARIAFNVEQVRAAFARCHPNHEVTKITREDREVWPNREHKPLHEYTVYYAEGDQEPWKSMEGPVKATSPKKAVEIYNNRHLVVKVHHLLNEQGETVWTRKD